MRNVSRHFLAVLSSLGVSCSSPGWEVQSEVAKPSFCDIPQEGVGAFEDAVSFDSRTWTLVSTRRLARPATERGVYVFDVSPNRAVLIQNGGDLQLRASGRCWTLLSDARLSWARFTDQGFVQAGREGKFETDRSWRGQTYTWRADSGELLSILHSPSLSLPVRTPRPDAVVLQRQRYYSEYGRLRLSGEPYDEDDPVDSRLYVVDPLDGTQLARLPPPTNDFSFDHLRIAFLLPVARLRDNPLVVDLLGVYWRNALDPRGLSRDRKWLAVVAPAVSARCEGDRALDDWKSCIVGLVLWNLALGTHRILPIDDAHDIRAIEVASDGRLLGIGAVSHFGVYDVEAKAFNVRMRLPRGDRATRSHFSIDARHLSVFTEQGYWLELERID